MLNGWHVSAGVVYAGALALTVLAVAVSRVAPIDDAYIFLRYARNIAVGDGYAFNPGRPVEGTTSLLWTWLLVIPAWLDLPLEAALYVFSLSSLALTILVLAVWLKRIGISSGSALCAIGLLLVTENFPRSIMMGLETGLYAALLLIFVVTLLREPFLSWASVLAGLALFLTRPESALILVLAGGWIIWQRGWAVALKVILCWFSGIVLVTMARLLYFGEILPTSAIAKSVPLHQLLDPAVLLPRLCDGVRYTAGWSQSSWIILLPAIIGLGVRLRQQSTDVVLLVLVSGATISVVLLNSGDWMPFYRLLVVLLPLAAWLSAIAIEAARTGLATLRPRLDLVVLGGSAVMLGGGFLLQLSQRGVFEQDVWDKGICYRALGQTLDPFVAPDTLVASESIGLLGYTLSRASIFDFFGLTEPYIAHHGLFPIATFTMGKHEYAYTLQQRPDVFVFHTTDHIGRMRPYGYDQLYLSYQASLPACTLLIGIHNDQRKSILPLLQRTFHVESFEAAVR